ncbi:hypothetical protein KBD18_00795 [Patescibacteria group bacterium]|nr:hypothetical protein [Patescibacteria group bacterium]
MHNTMHHPPHFALLRSVGAPIDEAAAQKARWIIETAATMASALGRVFAQAIALNANNVQMMFEAQQLAIERAVPKTFEQDEHRSIVHALMGIYLFSGAQSALLQGASDLALRQRCRAFHYATLGQQCLTEALHHLPKSVHESIFGAWPQLYQQNPCVSAVEWDKFCRGALAVSHVAACLAQRSGVCYLPETRLDQEYATDLLYCEDRQGYAIQIKSQPRSSLVLVTDEMCERAATGQHARQLSVLRMSAHHLSETCHRPFVPLVIWVELKNYRSGFGTSEIDTDLESYIHRGLDVLGSRAHETIR